MGCSHTHLQRRVVSHQLRRRLPQPLLDHALQAGCGIARLHPGKQVAQAKRAHGAGRGSQPVACYAQLDVCNLVLIVEVSVEYRLFILVGGVPAMQSSTSVTCMFIGG